MTCPDLETCNIPIAKAYFQKICHGKDSHENCHYYCKRHDLLKPPIQWLQHLAVMAELRPPEAWIYERKV